MSRATPHDLREAEAVDGIEFDAMDAPAEAGSQKGSGRRRAWVAILQALLVAVVLGGGAAAALYLLRTGPKAKRRTREPRATLVSVREVTPSSERCVVLAMGTVRAAQSIELKPRVSGEIVGLSPECIPGGLFKAGDVVATIDPADYKLAIEQQETQIKQLAAPIEQKRAEIAQRASEVVKAASAIEQSKSEILQRESAILQAEAAVLIERGQQAVAEREYKLLGRELPEADRDLVLRKPQLQQAQAALGSAKAAKGAAEAARQAAIAAKASAEALTRSAEAAVEGAEAGKAAAEVALKQAKLDLERATIRAPFNAIVEAEAVDKGSQVSPQTSLATLVGTDEYWAEVSVPVDQLRWIQFPKANGGRGSSVRIYNEAAWGPDQYRAGHAARLTGALEPEGRMARILVAVPDPLGLREASARPPTLLIGSYVRVEIDGLELENVVPLDRGLVHEGDSVWVMNAQGKLEIRKVTIAFRGRERLLVTDGLAAGDKLVTTNLAAPVAGTPLRTGSDAAQEGAAPNAGRAPGTRTEGAGQ